MRWHCPFKGCSIRHHGDDLYDHLTGVHGLSSAEANRHQYAAERQQAYAKLTAQAGVKTQGWTLDTFPAEDIAGRRALNAVRQWIEDDDTYTETCFLSGPPGTGKTGLAIGAAKAIIDCHYDWDKDSWDVDRVEFVNVRAFLEQQREHLSRGEPKDISAALRADLLILDDLGAERATEFAVETIALIVEQRHTKWGTTIVTTNYKPSDLAGRLGRDDPVAGQRIVSRLLEDATKIELRRADLRVRRTAA